MKKIGFIGAYDKTDFVLYVGRILVEMGQRVLMIDGTITQKARYIIPTMEEEKSYVTNFEGVDVAVGLRSLEEIATCLGTPELQYDIVLIDTDTAGGVASYRVQESEKIYFTTSFDLYSIKRGIESVAGIPQTVNATKVLFTRNGLKEEDEYLNYLSKDTNIRWDKEIIYFPFELGDQSIIYRNQRVAKIKMARLSNQYKEGLLYIVSQILQEDNYSLLKKTIKKIERGV